MEHTLLVPPMALVDIFGVSAIRLSARKAIVLDAAGATVLTVTRDKTQPAGQDFSDWLKWIQAKAVRQRMARVSPQPAQAGGQPMVKVKFMDGTPVPDDYLTSASLLVRDAALAINMFGEDELEAASRCTSQDGREAAMEQKPCCVCGGEIFDEGESAFGACEDCLDNAHRDPEAFIEQAFSEEKYVVRTYGGREGDVDAAYPTLQEAIAAFQAAPVNSNPRVIREGRTLAALDRMLVPVLRVIREERVLAALDRKLVPVFSDAEAERIHRELFGGFVLRTYAGFGKGDVDMAHPTLEAAMAAFAAAPVNALPRVLRDGRTVAELDPEAGLAPIFGDDKAQRIYRRMFDQGALYQEHSQS